MTPTLRQAAGSTLVVGLCATELTALERAWLQLVRPAGIILFRRNIADPRQSRALLGDATGLCAPNAFRCVDLEGGSVDRLRDALASMPAAQSVAAAARQAGKEALAVEHGELVAEAVRAFGFNVTLAPVLDLALPASAGVMGTRAAAPDSHGVVVYARSFLAGLRRHNIVGCGKHFPGLGGGKLDSHLETPAIARSSREIWAQDLAPYRELRNELPMAMINHASYPATPSGRLPASVSQYWITTVLRKRIGYRGIAFSDDLEMGGILKFTTIEEASLESIRAGMDLLEICHSPELILRAYEALLTEAERSPAFRKILLGRAHRMAARRRTLFSSGPSRLPTATQIDRLRTRILRFAETIASVQPAPRGVTK